MMYLRLQRHTLSLTNLVEKTRGTIRSVARMTKTSMNTVITTALSLALCGFLSLCCTAAVAAGGHDEQREAVRLLNLLRTRQGIAPLAWEPSSQLQAAAKVRSEELERQFSHSRPDGRDCASVLKEFGLHFRKFGENIAAGTHLSADGAIRLWSKSPGHNANMMNPRFKEIGLASWHDRNGNVYWVQLFLTR